MSVTGSVVTCCAEWRSSATPAETAIVAGTCTAGVSGAVAIAVSVPAVPVAKAVQEVRAHRRNMAMTI